MIELYGFGSSRWVKCYWMLKELNVPFKEHRLDLSAGELKKPEVLKLNPFGKAPFIKDSEMALFESLAILNYLGEKYPESKLVPNSGTHERALYDQWMSFCVTELEQPLWRMVRNLFIYPENRRIPQDIVKAKEDFTETVHILDPLPSGLIPSST